MGRAVDDITPAMIEFIERQHMFFVATAPVSGGRVNVSPKGYDTFRVLDSATVCYLDITGSGSETIAHLRENGRITFMFCAFEGKPNIVRLYGTGRIVRSGDEEYDELIEGFDSVNGARSIVIADINRTSTSCGYSVPFMDFNEERSRLDDHWSAKTDDEIAEYWERKNTQSIDGLPSL